MRDGAHAAAVTAAASEETCIVIGVDADGTVRVGQYRQRGQLSVAYAARPAEWLCGAIGKIVAESVADAGATAGASPCRGC
jgi:hypothetical protein